MGTRALAAVLLAPSLTLAQTAGLLTADPTEFGRADCNAISLGLTWTSATAAVQGDNWRVGVYADTDTCPTTAPVATASNVVVDQLTISGSTTGRATLDRGVIETAGGVTCVTSGSAADVVKKLCAWLVTNPGTAETSALVAQGTFTFQFARPPPPVLSDVAPADSALKVTFTRGADSPPDDAVPLEYRIDVFLSGALVTSLTTQQTSGVRVGGLVNGTTYDVEVVALSSGLNVSLPSNTLSGTPLPFKSFWDNYQNAGGQEQGGCGGGAGALSLLSLLPLALRRRRP
jgi:hypothetical protein